MEKIRPYTSQELRNMTTEQLTAAFLELAKKRNFSERTIEAVTWKDHPNSWRHLMKMEWFLMHPNDDEEETLHFASMMPE